MIRKTTAKNAILFFIPLHHVMTMASLCIELVSWTCVCWQARRSNKFLEFGPINTDTHSHYKYHMSSRHRHSSLSWPPIIVSKNYQANWWSVKETLMQGAIKMNLLEKLHRFPQKMSKLTFAVLNFETQKPLTCWSDV